MGDEEVGEAEVAAELDEQVHHLGLDRDVERGDRLVEHHELGLEHERPGDGDPLPLPTGELVGIAGERRGRHARPFEGRRHPPQPLRPVAEPMDDEPLLEDRPHRHPGVERAVGILEHDLHPAPERPQRRLRQAPHVVAREPDAPRGRLDEPEEAAAHGRLAAATLPHEAERLAAGDRERHAVDRADGTHRPSEQPAADRKMRLEAGDGQERLRWGGHRGAASGAGGPCSPAKWQRTT